MIYNEFKGLQLSALGMGGMRLPRCGEKDTDVDVAATREMFRYAMEHGVNYFDTAYRYHGGRSEEVFGEVLSEFPRESYYLATKFPGFETEHFESKEAIFEEQLKKCRTEYFDFYLLHCVFDKNIDNYVNPDHRLREYLIEQKKQGRIRHLGFSAHCDMEAFHRIFDFYGDLMEFCQLQLNWMDYTHEHIGSQYQYLVEHNIPVWVMEPVRGGGLINLRPVFERRLRALDPTRANVEWAFRFQQSLSGVTMTLSGMSNMQQLKENIAYYEERKPLEPAAFDTLVTMGREMKNPAAVPCTTCRYCLPVCPQGLNVPLFTNAYNDAVFEGEEFTLPEALAALLAEQRSTACIGCGACEKACPQNIKIADLMTKFSERYYG